MYSILRAHKSLLLKIMVTAFSFILLLILYELGTFHWGDAWDPFGFDEDNYRGLGMYFHDTSLSQFQSLLKAILCFASFFLTLLMMAFVFFPKKTKGKGLWFIIVANTILIILITMSYSLLNTPFISFSHGIMKPLAVLVMLVMHGLLWYLFIKDSKQKI